VHGEARWNARLVPLTVDGLIYASSMVLLDSARRKVPVPAPARWLLGLGIGATPAANAAHGLGHGPVGAAVAAWPAVVLVGSYELLMMIIRGAQVPADVTAVAGLPGRPPDADPLQMQVAQVFADDVAADRVASVRAIETRAQLCSGLLSLQRARRSNRRSPGVPPHGRAQRPGRRLNRGSFPATGRGSPTPLVNAALHT
jgi:hypothetical protein